MNRPIPVSLICLGVVVTYTEKSTADLNHGLVAFYPFDGGVIDDAGNCDGRVSGPTPSEDRFGNPRGAYSFDGVDDSIRIPCSLEPPTFTLGIWFRTTAPGRAVIWLSDPDGYLCSHGYALEIVNGKARAGIDPSGRCGDGSAIDSDRRVDDGNWHHAAFSYDGVIRLYIDGLRASRTLSTAYQRTGAEITIGKGVMSRSPYQFCPFRGSIDEIRLYNRRLSDSEIAELAAFPPDDLETQLPSDCNQDTVLDVSDAICLLGFLFLGNPATLPCGDSTGTDPANVALLDCNGDDELDLSDGICVLTYLFGGGPPPALGVECVSIPDCPDSCAP